MDWIDKVTELNKKRDPRCYDEVDELKRTFYDFFVDPKQQLLKGQTATTMGDNDKDKGWNYDGFKVGKDQDKCAVVLSELYEEMRQRESKAAANKLLDDSKQINTQDD